MRWGKKRWGTLLYPHAIRIKYASVRISTHQYASISIIYTTMRMYFLEVSYIALHYLAHRHPSPNPVDATPSLICTIECQSKACDIRETGTLIHLILDNVYVNAWIYTMLTIHTIHTQVCINKVIRYLPKVFPCSYKCQCRYQIISTVLRSALIHRRSVIGSPVTNLMPFLPHNIGGCLSMYSAYIHIYGNSLLRVPERPPRMWLRALSAESLYRTGPSVWYVPYVRRRTPSTLVCRATSAIVHVDDLHPWPAPTVVPQTCQDRQMSTSKLQSCSVTIPRNLGSREKYIRIVHAQNRASTLQAIPFRV
ncbi:hypothetical protein F4805DRAFT_296163 [Annulohypoxylon moriforme]|nr:hypothetical protein F4805DRAFT_296163 [Annulohypoxylon moriforme]